jgi:GNAT superfamily N-acetyltransferase
LAEIPGSRWVIARLGREHDRAAFDCGHAALNDWLKQRACQFDQRDLARTYVAVRDEERPVLGYYAISSHRVRREDLPDDQAKGLPRIDVPVVLLGRLAIDRSVQGRGLGSLLLIDALRRAERLAEQVGIRAVEVDAIDDTACAFYQKFGFVPLLDDPRHLFLPMSTIRKVLTARPREGDVPPK